MRSMAYERCGWQGGILTFGCSLGATHAANLFLRFPDIFDGTLALSGIYASEYGFGGYMDEEVYRNSPVHYIANLPADHPYIEKYNRTREDELKALEVTAQIAQYAEQIANDYGAVFVRFKDALDSYMDKAPLPHIVWDGIHPTYVGHGILAKCWLETVEKAFEEK